MDLLKHIVFRTAEDMREVKNKEAQLVVMSPAHFENEEYERKLLGNIFKECNRIVKKDGVIAAAFTDYKRHGGTYPKHLIVCKAAEENGFETFDHRAVVWTFKTQLMRKGYYNVYVFKRKGEKCLRAKYEDYKPYNYQPWLLTAPQQVKEFADAIDPEVYELLVEKFTRKGDLVVTPFAGSGTGVIMALNLGRKALGYETDKSRKKLFSAREQQILERTCFSPTSPIELHKKKLKIETRLVAA